MSCELETERGREKAKYRNLNIQISKERERDLSNRSMEPSSCFTWSGESEYGARTLYLPPCAPCNAPNDLNLAQQSIVIFVQLREELVPGSQSLPGSCVC
jgi:hypothetical protein